MAKQYERHDSYGHATAAVTEDFRDRHKSSRIKENIWQQQAIANIEDFLATTDWDSLGGDMSGYATKEDLAALNPAEVPGLTELEDAVGGWEEQLENYIKSGDVDSAIGAYLTKEGIDKLETTFSSERSTVADAIAAAQAGWADDVKAWNQQGINWEEDFAQQQRAFETQQATALEQQQGQFESQQTIMGLQNQIDRTAWEKSAETEREAYADQLEKAGIAHGEQLEELKATFAQEQEATRLAAETERSDMESQLKTTYGEIWNTQQQELTDTYQSLLDKATTDAEEARLLQAKDFEQRQLDQQAKWNEESQLLADQDKVFDTQIAGLKSDVGLFHDAATTAATERSHLQTQVGGLSKNIDEATSERATLEAAIRRNEEQAILNAERTRTAMAYATQGSPTQEQVQGVRTLNELTPTKQKGGGTRGSFNRKGLRIKNLNI